MDAPWTLDELVRRVAAALDGPAYPGAPNGRVRDVPDGRAVRWYTTIGLVDRPVSGGRTARYGPRHLLQVVAVKRRQAQGRTLAEVQSELSGAADATLRAVADVPVELLATDGAAPAPAPRPRFWAERPAPPDTGTGTVTALSAVPLAGGATLLVPGHPRPDDLTAIRTAAAALLDLLAERGLLDSR
jgi:MerR HTH family regulatory protein